MKSINKRDQLRTLAKDPIKYLAYRGIRAALEKSRPYSSCDEGFKIVVVPSGFQPLAYKSAMHLVLGVASEEWGVLSGEIRLANPLKNKASLDKPISVFDLEGLRVLIAGNIDEVPADVRFAASDVLYLEAPSAKDIVVSRRILGREPLGDEVAQFLVGKPQNLIVASIYRKSVELDDVQSLFNSAVLGSTKPDLFELPGFDELKYWAKEVQSDVEKWKLGKLSWKDIDHGALVSGPPGTGKTLFASALAESLGFKLITATVGGWQAAGSLDDMLREMRKSFHEANSVGRAVLFFDEFDSIGRRAAGPSGDHNDQYWRVVINHFLNQMNGIHDGVVMVAATNHPEWIDPAILRAGRIERHFVLSLPDKMTRAEILKYYLGDALDITTLLTIAGDLEGKTAASLEDIVRTARRIARDKNRDIALSDLEATLPDKLPYTLEQQFQLAVHEAGHALIALSLGFAKSATIEIQDTFDPTSDGYLGGRTTYEQHDDHFPTESSLLNRIAVCLSGMAAEAVVFNNRSVGSGGVTGSDIERATAIARRMVGSYGLGKSPVFVGSVEVVGDTQLRHGLDEEVVEILQTQYERATAILKNEKERLLELAADVVNNPTVTIERRSGTQAA